jgi:hypothetical protein
MTLSIAFDPGFGNIKLYGAQGPLVMQSAVSAGGTSVIGRIAGLHMAKPALRIETGAGVFHVGEGAHDWGRPVENLDLDRLAGSPELMALLYGAVTRFAVPADPVTLIVGLPIRTLMGEEAKDIQRSVRAALQGTHTWYADGVPCRLTVNSVRITSQSVGAMFDYLLDHDGVMVAKRRSAFMGELAVLGIGMNTVDLLVVRAGSPVQRFTAGQALGQGAHSLAELDSLLRSHALDASHLLGVWQSEVFGFVEHSWGSAFRRFSVVVTVGGGAELLREPLLRRFRDKVYVPDDPIIATARGLFKYSLAKTRRASSG